MRGDTVAAARAAIGVVGGNADPEGGWFIDFWIGQGAAVFRPVIDFAPCSAFLDFLPFFWFCFFIIRNRYVDAAVLCAEWSARGFVRDTDRAGGDTAEVEVLGLFRELDPVDGSAGRRVNRLTDEHHASHGNKGQDRGHDCGVLFILFVHKIVPSIAFWLHR